MPRLSATLGLVLVPLLLTACRTTAPVVEVEDGIEPAPAYPQEPAYLAVPETDVVRVPRSVEELVPVLPTDDPALDRMLVEVALALEGHGWRRIALLLDPEAYRAQFAFLAPDSLAAAVAAAETIEVSLGLGYVGNEIFPEDADRDADPFAGLRRIRTATLDAVEPPPQDGVAIVKGQVTLEDETERPLDFFVVPTPGGYRIAVPQG